MSALIKPHKLHVVDVLGNVIGRDQPVMRIDKALELVSLLDEESFADNNAVFFDPFCKAGEILFACAYMSCSVKSKQKLMSTEEIYREIFASNRYFALAPDERHHRLSLRTFLGNKNSHRTEYNHIIKNGNYLSEIDGTLDKHRFNEEFKTMIEYIKKATGNKKIIAVGNPPYQEADGGAQKSAKPVYNFFVEQLMDGRHIEKFVLVIPARWFAVGKGLYNFRCKMMSTRQLKEIKYFGKSGDIFPTVDIDGGVCFISYDKNHNSHPNFTNESMSITVDLSKFDIIPDDPKAFSILRKIRKNWNGKYISDVAWSGKPFGMRTFWFERNKACDKHHPQALKCYARGKKINYVKRSAITKNIEKVGEWKVAIPNAYGGKKGNRRITIPANSFFILERDEVATESYNVIDSYKNKRDADNLVTYLQTDFARYLLGLRKLTQHIPKDRWAWVPLLDNLQDITEDKIYKMFKLTADEVEHIRKKVKEWS